MNLYYSGTGNSKYCAEVIADKLNDTAYNISKVSPEKLPLKDLSTVGFVFPVYAWGVPPIVEHYVSLLPDELVNYIIDKRIPIWMLATCGDDTGMTDAMFRKILLKRGLDLKGIWSVTMPNIYVLLPGFDVDTDNIRLKKLEAIDKELNLIAGKISKGEWERNIHTGSFPRLKTGIVYPLFKKWGINTSKWRATDDCTGCGLCVKACPVNNIELINGRPEWHKNCLSCVSCYHECPHNAIQYGKITIGKGQYLRKMRPIFSRK